MAGPPMYNFRRLQEGFMTISGDRRLLLICAAVLVGALGVQRLQGQAKTPQEKSQAAPTAVGSIEMLTPTGGANFADYLGKMYKAVRLNWFAAMPVDVQLGEKGVVSVQFTIEKDGKLKEGTPTIVFSSRKNGLDRASLTAIRKSAPFAPLPKEFEGPCIDLRLTFYYNVAPPKQ